MVLFSDSSRGSFHSHLCRSRLQYGRSGELLPVQRWEETVLRLFLRLWPTSEAVEEELWASGPQDGLIRLRCDPYPLFLQLNIYYFNLCPHASSKLCIEKLYFVKVPCHGQPLNIKYSHRISALASSMTLMACRHLNAQIPLQTSSLERYNGSLIRRGSPSQAQVSVSMHKANGYCLRCLSSPMLFLKPSMSQFLTRAQLNWLNYCML